MPKGFTQKGIIAIVVAVAIIGGYAIGYTTAPKGGKLDQVTIILNWATSGERTGFYMADTMGFYAEEGLSVTVLRGYGSDDTALRVEVGEAEFGYFDMGTQVLAEASGDVDVLAVAAILHKSPIAVMFPPDSPITEPKDLEGKTIAANPSSSGYLTFIGAFAAHTGLDVDAVNFDFTSPYAKIALVLAGQADAATGYSTGDGQKLAHELGDVGMFLFADYGVDIYANAVVCKPEYAQENPDIVRRFVKATLNGWNWSLNNQAESVERLLELYPELDPEITALEANATLEMYWNEETQEYGVGYMIPEKVELTIQVTLDAFDIDEEMLPEEIYTNEFVEDLPDEISFPG